MKVPIQEIERRAIELHNRIAGMPPEFQSAIIAHLLATWIAGHRGGDNKALEKFREELLVNHIALVRKLIPLEDARIEDQS